MPAATTEAPTVDQPLVSQPDTSALFMSIRSELRLVWDAIEIERDERGRDIGRTRGKTLRFRDGVLRVPLDPKAEVILENGETANAGEALAFLLGHRMLSNVQEGFWQVDPTAPPASDQELGTLQDMALALDADGLRAFIDQESTGWHRQQLLDVAEGTLARIESAEAQRAGEIEQAREEGRQEAAKAKPAKAAPEG